MTEQWNVSGRHIDVSTVLIVIPCLNEADFLPGLLSWLVAEAPAAQIVVADGGSTDGSIEQVEAFAARAPTVHLLRNEKRIQSAGVNLAVERFGAGCDWLLRIDAHCSYPLGYVAGLVECAVARGADSVVVPMLSKGRGCFQRAAAAAQNSVIGTGGSPHRHLGRGRFVDHGHHALMRVALFMAAGGYREALSHNEDAELDIRLGLLGGRIWLEPSQAITYYPRRTPRALGRQYFGYGRGRAATIRLHHSRLKPRQAIPLLVPPALALLAGSVLAWPLALPALIWALACLSGGLVLAARSGERCAVFSGIAAMLMHAGWAFGYLAERVNPRPIGRLVEPLGFR